MTKEKQKIYLETSVISAYFDFWGKSLEQKNATKKFWRKILPKFTAYISPTVINELVGAKDNWIKKYLNLINKYESLTLDSQVDKVVKKYITHGIIPKSKIDDATHLATACRHKMNYFVSWNMRHLVRPHKINQITDFNLQHKIFLPTITKPSDFLVD